MKNQTNSYTPPRMEFSEITIEQGIAASGNSEPIIIDPEQEWS